jgi:serine/threonine protein kinase
MSTKPTRELHGLALDQRMPRLGERVALRYEVLEVLGVGGFAVVYRARDTRLGGEVALKVLEPDKSASPDFVTRFQQEINLVRQLRHHNTIKIWDAGLTEQRCLYMASELVDGEELSALITREAPLPVARVKRLVGQVLKSLAEAHKGSIVHRDLKPSNIMVAQLDGEPDYVKVVDFGIAKALTPDLSMIKTQTGMVMCTPSYASPEVLRNQNIGPPSDLYALGLIMIELLTGQQAVQGQSQVDIIVRQIDPAPVDLPPWLAEAPIGRLIARAVAKSVDERYPDALSMLRDLEALSEYPLAHPSAGPLATAAPAFGPPPSEPVPWPPRPSPSTPLPRTPSAPVGPFTAPASNSAQTLISGRNDAQRTDVASSASATSAKLPWILALVALLAAGALALALLTREPGRGDSPGAASTGGTEQPGGDPGAPAGDDPAVPPGGETVAGPTEDPVLPPVDPPAVAPGVEVAVLAAPGPDEATRPLPDGENVASPGPAADPVPQVEAPVVADGPGDPAAEPEPAPGHDNPPVEFQVATAAPRLLGALGLQASQTAAPEPEGVEAPLEEPPLEEPPLEPPLEVAVAAPVAPAGPFRYSISARPDRVRLSWRYAEAPQGEWSSSTRCDRHCVVEVPEARAIEVRLRKDDHCTRSFTLTPDPTHGPWELVLEQGCFERNTICYNTCQWANDGECDDGGPGSLYNICAFGTDCADCGPRRLGR